MVTETKYWFENILDRKVKSLQIYLQKPRQLKGLKQLKIKLRRMLKKCTV